MVCPHLLFLFRLFSILKAFYQDIVRGMGILEGWLVRNGFVYLVWSLLFLPFAFYGFWLDAIPVQKALLVWLRNVLFIGENYLSWPLWYLLGLLQGGVIIGFCQKCKLPFFIQVILGVILYFIPSLVHLETIPYYHSVFGSTRNGIFIGFPFMVLGGLFSRRFQDVKGWKKTDWQYRCAIVFRYFSIVIYLSHMLWAGMILIFSPMERGFAYWTVTVAFSLCFAMFLYPFPGWQKILLGRSFI